MDRRKFTMRKRILPEDWHLFKSEFYKRIKGYDIYKVQKMYYLQVKSKEYFGYRNLEQLEKALSVLPDLERSN